ncbi:unnamed protein product [Pararhodospirillum photometricum DSM 122]|uniref:Uncharacterized protein n=1 Tax=Pararhodospirillum photometricum DSM 122 TaxID=1150469 RepID=H6SQ77_PARPM|nr:unnamed protein product [Pararhodospirillum photometricum DSM 122]
MFWQGLADAHACQNNPIAIGLGEGRLGISGKQCSCQSGLNSTVQDLADRRDHEAVLSDEREIADPFLLLRHKGLSLEVRREQFFIQADETNEPRIGKEFRQLVGLIEVKIERPKRRNHHTREMALLIVALHPHAPTRRQDFSILSVGLQ